MNMKSVIMAGGKGTRIASINSDVPKPMIEICGKPILLWQIENLKACGLTDITLVIGHLGHVIRDYFQDGSNFGVHISYFEEKEPLGTAGDIAGEDITGQDDIDDEIRQVLLPFVTDQAALLEKKAHEDQDEKGSLHFQNLFHNTLSGRRRAALYFRLLTLIIP